MPHARLYTPLSDNILSDLEYGLIIAIMYYEIYTYSCVRHITPSSIRVRAPGIILKNIVSTKI